MSKRTTFSKEFKTIHVSEWFADFRLTEVLYYFLTVREFSNKSVRIEIDNFFNAFLGHINSKSSVKFSLNMLTIEYVPTIVSINESEEIDQSLVALRRN